MHIRSAEPSRRTWLRTSVSGDTNMGARSGSSGVALGEDRKQGGACEVTLPFGEGGLSLCVGGGGIPQDPPPSITDVVPETKGAARLNPSITTTHTHEQIKKCQAERSVVNT